MKKVGIIAGNGEFPIICAKAAKEKGVSVIAVALRDETSPEIEKFVDKIYWIDIGQLRSLIDMFKKEGIKKAIMAGKITKTRLFKDTPKLDSAAKGLLKNAVNKNDMSLLRGVAGILKIFGITLIDSTYYIKHLMPPKGIISKRLPTKQEEEDIRFGFSLAKKMGKLDIGQTVVVKNKSVLAIEAIEGTDEAILRGGNLGSGNIVVVKTARPGQDKRFDIPTIGPQTLRSLEKAGGGVLAMEAKKMLLINKEECVALADTNGLSLVAV